MRLIDADALEPDADYYEGDYWAVSIVQIHNAPTIEPEIVRCKACRHYNSHDHKCKVWNHGVILSGFCHEAMKGEKNETD